MFLMLISIATTIIDGKDMKKIATVNGDQAKALGGLLENLGFLSHLQIQAGTVNQKIGDDAYISADLASLVQNSTLHLTLDKLETKTLKAIDPGKDDVEIYEGDEYYTFAGGNYEVSLGRHEPLIGPDPLPQIESPVETIFSWGCAAGSSLQKAYASILAKKGPLTVELDGANICTGIVNNLGSRFRMNSQTMIPTEQRVAAAQTEMKLHSFWLHEFKGENIDLRIHKLPAVKPAYGVHDYWLEADIAFGSGVVVSLIEKMLPQLW